MMFRIILFFLKEKLLGLEYNFIDFDFIFFEILVAVEVFFFL